MGRGRSRSVGVDLKFLSRLTRSRHFVSIRVSQRIKVIWPVGHGGRIGWFLFDSITPTGLFSRRTQYDLHRKEMRQNRNICMYNIIQDIIQTKIETKGKPSCEHVTRCGAIAIFLRVSPCVYKQQAMKTP